MEENFAEEMEEIEPNWYSREGEVKVYDVSNDLCRGYYVPFSKKRRRLFKVKNLDSGLENSFSEILCEAKMKMEFNFY